MVNASCVFYDAQTGGSMDSIQTETIASLQHSTLPESTNVELIENPTLAQLEEFWSNG